MTGKNQSGMSRRSFFAVSSAACFGAAMAHAIPMLKGKRPNILLIMTDDQGYGDLSCHGNAILKTPHLDKLHSESVRFTQFQVSPTCAPTRTSIMTGRHEFKSGVTHTILERERMALDRFILPQALQSAGYTTGIFGKWHLGDPEPYRPDKRGFDEVFIHGAGGIGQSYQGTCGDAPNNTYFDPWILHNNVFEKTEGFCTDVFFNQATSWMKQQRQTEKPFFCYIPTNAPHGPFIAPEEYKKPFLEQGLSEKRSAFYGMITNIDDNVGRLMQQLDKWGMAEDTLVVFMTDNGQTGAPSEKGDPPAFNAGMKGRKGSVDEGGTRAPCFFRWKNTLPAGVDVNQLTAHYDLYPTLAEIAGATVPEEERKQFEGRSLVPLLKDQNAVWKDRYLVAHRGRWPRGTEPTEHKFKNYSIRSSRFRLVGTDKLYDMQNDLGQKTNVIDEHPDVVKDMLAFYDQWWAETRPLMCNEDAPMEGPNTFHVLFEEQFGKKK